MFESFWARQARVRVGLVKNAYKPQKNLYDFVKTVLSLQDGYITCQKAYKTNEMFMVLTRPWRIGVGVVWPVVILRLKH